MKNILVFTDFSESSKAAEKFALQVAIKVRANLILYNAYPELTSFAINGNLV
jgi:nucleotide-binding universal stress UspA family protein